MAINLIPANLAWLFLIFPIGILEIVASYLDGHSVAVKKIIQEHVDNE
jgi:hypothetical protein